LIGRQDGEELQDARDDARPTGLVARAQPRAIVAMKVFVEQNVVAPMRIRLKLLGAAVERPSTVRIALEYRTEPARYLPGHLV
jgi:hypothetical protein